MQKQGYKIEGWGHQDPLVSLSHRHQLRPLQEIIQKAKKLDKIQKRQLKLDSLHSKVKLQDDQSFLSLKTNRKKFKTQQIQRAVIPTSQHANNNNNNIHQLEHYFPISPLNETKGVNKMFKNIVTLIDKQPSLQSSSPTYFLRKRQNLSENKIRDHRKSRSIQNIFEKKLKESKQKRKKIKLKTLEKQYKYPIHSQNCLVILPKSSKDQRIRQLKAYFLNTVQGRGMNKWVQKEKQQKKEDYRWKKILNKSNRQKKQLAELFRTTVSNEETLGQKNVISSRRIDKIGVSKSRPQLRQIITSEFDDEGLYCSWSRSQKRIIPHFEAKSFNP